MKTATESQHAKAKLLESFDGTVSAKVTIIAAKGTTVWVIIGETAECCEAEIDKLAVNGLRAGNTVVRSDGAREWIEVREIIDHTKNGGDVYIWHADGNRVKHERVHVITDADGNRTETVVGTSYRLFE